MDLDFTLFFPPKKNTSDTSSVEQFVNNEIKTTTANKPQGLKTLWKTDRALGIWTTDFADAVENLTKLFDQSSHALKEKERIFVPRLFELALHDTRQYSSKFHQTMQSHRRKP